MPDQTFKAVKGCPVPTLVLQNESTSLQAGSLPSLQAVPCCFHCSLIIMIPEHNRGLSVIREDAGKDTDNPTALI